MRKFVALTAFCLLLATSSFPALSLPSDSYDVGVRRVVTVGEYGVVVTNDTFSIFNNGTSSIAALNYALRRPVSENLRHIYAKDSSGVILDLDRDIDGSSTHYWIRVNLREELPPGGTTSLHIVSAYSNLVRFVKAVSAIDVEDKFAVSVPAFVTLQRPARSCNVTVHAVGDARFQLSEDSGFVEAQFGGGIALAGQMLPLPAMTDRQLSFNFTSTAQRIVQCDWARREVEITPGGDLKVGDSYRLSNLGRPFQSVRLTLPKDAKEIMTYDELGVLSTTPFTSNQIDVAPRFSAVRQDESMTFIVKYQIPAGKGARQIQWWGHYDLTLDLLTGLPWIVDSAEVKVKAPLGLRVEAITPKPTRIESMAYETALIYEANYVTPLNELRLTMTYQYVPFWAGFIPMIWVTVIVGSVAAVWTHLKRRKVPEVPTIVPVDVIRRFVELYDERAALRLELDKMDQQLARGAMSRHEHRRRSRQIQDRNDAIWRELRPVRSALAETSTRYADMIRRIERAEAEIDAARASEAQLRSQYRSGRISREVYDQMRAEARRRLDRARGTIDSTIITLRGEAR